MQDIERARKSSKIRSHGTAEGEICSDFTTEPATVAHEVDPLENEIRKLVEEIRPVRAKPAASAVVAEAPPKIEALVATCVVERSLPGVPKASGGIRNKSDVPAASCE